MKLNIIWFCLLSLVFSACWEIENDLTHQEDSTVGYQPIYGPTESKEVKFLSPRPVANPGKIYRYNNYLLVNEIDKGIHVFENSDPTSPTSLGFIQILGNTDMAMANNILYADHTGNLIGIQFEPLDELKILRSLPLRNWNLGVPPPRGYAFECVDQQNGLVIGWKKVNNENLNCYALR